MVTDDREMERQENEAIKSAKEIIKKKTKNKFQKVAWNAVKVAVIPMFILMIKIIAITVLVCAVISMFSNILNDDGNSNSKLESSAATQIGGMDISTDSWKFTKSQIGDFINNYDTTNSELKEIILKRIDDIYNWQENYEYSAGLLITIAFEENRIDFDDFLNEMNQKGKEWKEKGYKNVHEIAQDYVGDDTSSEWANNIENKLKETGINAEIIKTGQEQVDSGDGYPNVYVSKSRKNI